MRSITQRKQFRDDLKRQKRRRRNVEDLIAVVEILAETGELPAGYHPHRLRGRWWLLIYEVTDTEVLLIRTGSHSELFE